jgi:D-inositol-3-phosphate glycosyltransferase
VGYLAKDRWGVPLIHSAHTLAKVKNAAMARSDFPEPRGRLIGEEQVVAEADRLIANTAAEATALVELYGAAPDRVDVIAPGVDTDVFRPGSKRAARSALGLPQDDLIVTFAGRIQPLKAPDVLLRAIAVLRKRHPEGRFRVLIVGGASGTGRIAPHRLDELATELQLVDVVRFLEPLPPAELCRVFQASDTVAVPSYNESFGLVALEAQAAGVPVVAAAVGGLRVAVDDGVSGLLVPDHDPLRWADRLASVLLDPVAAARLAAGAARQAARFSWDRTVDGLLESYQRAAYAASPVLL